MYYKESHSKKAHPGHLSQVVRSAYDTMGVVGGLFLSEEKLHSRDELGFPKLYDKPVINKHYSLLREDGYHVQQAFEMKEAFPLLGILFCLVFSIS